MAQFLDKQGLTTYSNLIKGELDALDARIEALETGGKYLPLTGGTMSGAIAMGNNKITGLATPTASTDAATKGYVDDKSPYVVLTPYSTTFYGNSYIKLYHSVTNSSHGYYRLEFAIPGSIVYVSGVRVEAPWADSSSFVAYGLQVYSNSTNYELTINSTDAALTYLQTASKTASTSYTIETVAKSTPIDIPIRNKIIILSVTS